MSDALTFTLMSAPGCVALLTKQVMCEEFSRCYDDVNICLWTDGSRLTQSAAQTACQQRNSSLPRVTNDNIRRHFAEFRHALGNLLGSESFWIDVKAVDFSNNFHWIDGSSLAGLFIYRHTVTSFAGLCPKYFYFSNFGTAIRRVGWLVGSFGGVFVDVFVR